MAYLVIIIVFIGAQQNVRVENLSYSFDSITITEAKTFDVIMPSNVDPGSLLFEKASAGDTLTVYVAMIELKEIGSELSSTSTVLIINNQAEENLIRFIVNNYFADLSVFVRYGFASHILIDSTMGVYKDLTMVDNIQEITVNHLLAGDVITLTDNKGLEIPMVEGTYQVETGLSNVISVNSG